MGRNSKTLTKTNDTAPDAPAEDEKPTISFAELGLAPEILRALDDLGYTTPTPPFLQPYKAKMYWGSPRQVPGKPGLSRSQSFTVCHKDGPVRACRDA
jgi:hypothetical protein